MNETWQIIAVDKVTQKERVVASGLTEWQAERIVVRDYYRGLPGNKERLEERRE